MYLGAQKNHLIEMVLLSTHNMFCLRKKKIIFNYENGMFRQTGDKYSIVFVKKS